eukprot:gene15877-18869_t
MFRLTQLRKTTRFGGQLFAKRTLEALSQQRRGIFFSSYIGREYEPGKDDEIFSEVVEAKKFEAKGNYAASKALLERAKDVIERAVGRTHPMALNVTFRLVNAEMAVGELQNAAQACQTILDRVPGIGEEHRRYVLPSLYNLMLCHQYNGDLESASKTAEQLVQAARIHGDHELIIGTLLNKAIVMSLSCNDDCQNVFEECISLSKVHLPPTHKLYEVDELATKYYALAIEHATRSGNDTELVNILTNHAEFLFDSEQFDKAETALTEASKKAEEVYGRQSPKVGSIVFIMAKLYRARGNHYWAEGLFNRCITIFEDYKNVSRLEQREKQKAEQETPQFTPGKREIELRTGKEVDIDYGNVLWEYAQMLREKGRQQEAINIEERVYLLRYSNRDKAFKIAGSLGDL